MENRRRMYTESGPIARVKLDEGDKRVPNDVKVKFVREDR